MDRGAWWATVHRVAKIRTWLSMHLGPCKVLELNLDFPIKPRTTKQCYMLKESAYQQRETSRNPGFNISTSKNPFRILTPRLLSPGSRVKTDSICLARESPSQENKGAPALQHLLVSNRSKYKYDMNPRPPYLRVCDILWSSSMLNMLIKIQNKKI